MGKIATQQELIVRCRERKQNGEKIVFVAGSFELLHPGHVRLLEQARDHGDVLVAAVLDDASVREVLTAEQRQPRNNIHRGDPPRRAGAEDAEMLPSRAGSELDRRDSPRPAGAAAARQGPSLRGVQRPVTPAGERAEILAALAAVDYAVEIGIDSLPELLAQLRPDVVVESAEPLTALVADVAERSRARVVRIPSEPGHSTAGIIERIVQLSGSE